MKLTLETVREALREALGFDSYVAGFITEIHEDSGQPSAGITKEGQLAYNPQFTAKYIKTKEDLFSLLFHELLHPMFNHFIHRNGNLENIAADAIINAFISSVYPKESDEGALFQKTYKPRGMEGLLRPQSQMRHSRYEALYDRLYESHRSFQKHTATTTGEMIQSLKILTEGETLEKIMLLGNHSPCAASETLSGLSAELLGRIAEEIKQSAAECTHRGAGYSLSLFSMVMEALRSHLSMRKALLRQFLSKRKIDRFKELFQDRRIGASPIPIQPSRRDLALLACGLSPFYYHNRLSKAGERKRGLAIYLDVSGSVRDSLPKIIGILRSLKKEIVSLFLFSNQAIEVPFDSLLQGHIKTTYGTDFNCIAQSILEREFDKAVIVTDGFASLDQELQLKLKSKPLKMLTILFGGLESCAAFEEFGDVVQLEEVCEQTN